VLKKPTNGAPQEKQIKLSIQIQEIMRRRNGISVSIKTTWVVIGSHANSYLGKTKKYSLIRRKAKNSCPERH